MTYLPFTNRHDRPHVKHKTMQPHCLEMTNLTESHTPKLEMFPRRVGKSWKPGCLLYLARSLLVLGVVVMVSLAGLGLHMFFSPEDHSADLFNVMVVGGRAEDNSSLLSVEILNMGGCPQDSSLLLVPDLPEALSDLWVTFLAESNKVEVCGEDGGDHWSCFSLSNSSSQWERSAGPVRGGLSSSSHPPVSERHGASFTQLGGRWLLVGGRRSVLHTSPPHHSSPCLLVVRAVGPPGSSSGQTSSPAGPPPTSPSLRAGPATLFSTSRALSASPPSQHFINCWNCLDMIFYRNQ